MKIIITESKLEKFFIKWLNDNYGDLEPYETEEYSDYIFYRKDKEIIFGYNKKNGYVYVNYDEIWSFLEGMFGMGYEQIEELTKVWVEERYNLKVTRTFIVKSFTDFRWRNIIN
jgi:hypothetical protein